MTERDISKLLRQGVIHKKRPGFFTFKLIERTRQLIEMGHVEKDLAIVLI